MQYRPHLLIAILLLAAGCGSVNEGGYDVADRILSELGQPAGEPEVDEDGCVTIEDVDEYGFVTEITTCADDSPVETIPAEAAEDAAGAEDPEEADDVVETEAEPVDPELLQHAAGDLPLWALPSLIPYADPAMRPALEAMLVTIVELDAACGNDFLAWRASLAELDGQASDLARVIESGQGSDYVGTTEARALSRALMERSLLQTGCASPRAGQPFTEAQLTIDKSLELTSKTALGLSELGRLIDDASSGYLFHFFTTADNYEWLRTQTSDLDLIVYGTSQAGAGIDIPLLGAELSFDAGNAFLYGSLAEVQQHWFPEVERYVNASKVVWLVGAIDLLLDCEPIGREKQFTDRITRRQRTFAASGWFDAIDPVNVVLGPVGPPNDNKGNGVKQPAPDPVALAGHQEEYTDRFAAAEFCESRAETIANAVERMAAEGRQVVIVGMPLSPIAYEALPGGVQAATDAIDRLAAKIDPAWAEVIDMTGLLQTRPDLWVDYTHLTAEGASAFTELLAAELRRVGVS